MSNERTKWNMALLASSSILGLTLATAPINLDFGLNAPHVTVHLNTAFADGDGGDGGEGGDGGDGEGGVG
ncbi:MAG: hypothetical protein ACE5DS_02385, partial [Kiloniellaceae bacterium]